MAIDGFNTHAAGYDSIAESALGIELRARVQSALHAVTAPGDNVADLGCGSGLDAAWLAPQVRSVQAFDASPAMVANARSRCAHLDNVSIEQADIAHLSLSTPVDVVLANFGVVNCVGNLAAFGSQLRQMLVPNGIAVLVTMARWCPVELGVAAATANRQLLQRRSGTTTYDGIDVRYASAQDLQTAFTSDLALTASESLGLVLPPFEQRQWVQGRPRFRRALAAADARLGRLGARARLGDHHIAVFKRAT